MIDKAIILKQFNIDSFIKHPCELFIVSLYISFRSLITLYEVTEKKFFLDSRFKLIHCVIATVYRLF